MTPASDPYWEYDESECWNCGGEGFVYGCSWDWQCDTYDEGEGTCLCTRRCHICNPPKADPALLAVLAEALASGTKARSGETVGLDPKGDGPARAAGDAQPSSSSHPTDGAE